MTPTSTSIDDEWEQERAEEEADRIGKLEAPPALTSALFLSWRSPRRGNGNPTRLDNPLWHWLVRTRWSAFRANELLAGPSSFNAGPMWCFERFGMSQTTLPDGRVIHIGGEHEDHYDPDFFIYNDVTVVDREGSISIYGYADTGFPPTDFHSATLVGKAIYVIGRLGYPERREAGSTPVYRLLLDSMSMEAVQTHGASPGWIHRHSASLGNDGAIITIAGGERWLGPDRAPAENIDSWSFDTRTGAWRRMTRHKWQRWTMRRMDRQPNRIWQTRQERWVRQHARLGIESSWPYEVEPDLAALAMLYRINEAAPEPVQGAEFGTYSVTVEGVTVRFHEDRFWIRAIVEGRLAKGQLTKLQALTLALLERIDSAPYVIEVQEDGDIDDPG